MKHCDLPHKLRDQSDCTLRKLIARSENAAPDDLNGLAMIAANFVPWANPSGSALLANILINHEVKLLDQQLSSKSNIPSFQPQRTNMGFENLQLLGQFLEAREAESLADQLVERLVRGENTGRVSIIFRALAPRLNRDNARSHAIRLTNRMAMAGESTSYVHIAQAIASLVDYLDVDQVESFARKVAGRLVASQRNSGKRSFATPDERSRDQPVGDYMLGPLANSLALAADRLSPTTARGLCEQAARAVASGNYASSSGFLPSDQNQYTSVAVLAKRMVHESAVRICEPKIKSIASALADKSDSSFRRRGLAAQIKVLSHLADYVSRSDAETIAELLVAHLVVAKANDGFSSINAVTPRDLVNALHALEGRVEKQAAHRLAESLLTLIKNEENTRKLPELARAWAVLAGRLNSEDRVPMTQNVVNRIKSKLSADAGEKDSTPIAGGLSAVTVMLDDFELVATLRKWGMFAEVRKAVLTEFMRRCLDKVNSNIRMVAGASATVEAANVQPPANLWEFAAWSHRPDLNLGS